MQKDLQPTPKTLILCFSQLRWGFVFQRPQHLMTHASATSRVIYWEEPMHKSGIESHLARFPQTPNLEVITPMLPEGIHPDEEVIVLRRMLDKVIEEEGHYDRVIAWFVTPMMLPVADHVKADVRVYDNMDELSAFKNAPVKLLELENQLLASSDVVFTGGMSIYEAKKDRHKNIHAFPSSIDKAHFASGRAHVINEPHDQASIAGPRIGWFGVIDERMDIGLVQDLAGLRPDWQFVMIGPIVKISEESLPKSENIHWLGSKDYNDLPIYLAGWSAGIIPFAINESTAFISPTKTPEYLAAGVPVVATPIRDIVRPYGERGFVEIANTAQEMAEALDKVMMMPKAPWITQIDQFLADKSWHKTWEGMNELIDAVSSNASKYSNQTVVN